jgi:hypothetical protein
MAAEAVAMETPERAATSFSVTILMPLAAMRAVYTI